MNRTLLNKAKCMSFGFSFPKWFCGEAIMTTYLVDKCLLSTINLKKPKKKWLDKPLDL